MGTRRFGRRLVAVAACLGLVAAACGDDDDNAGNATTTGATTTEGATTTAGGATTTGSSTESTAAETTAAGATTTITAPARGDADLVIWCDDTRKATVEKIAQAFASEQGIKIAVQEVPSDQIRPQFILAAPKDKGPDIVVGAHDWIGELSSNGVLEPLTLAKPDDFQKVAVQGFTYNGALYGVPYAVENVALVRNTTLAPTAPATFEDMVKAAQDFKAQHSGDPTYLGLAVQVGPQGDAYHFQPSLSAYGGYMLGQNAEGTYNIKDVGLDTDGSLAAAQFLADSAKDGVMSADVTYDVMIQSFGEGKAPFAITGPWAIAQENNGFLATKVPYEVTPIPARTGGKAPAVFVGVQGFMVSSFSKNKDVAKSFVQDFMTQEAQQLAMFEAGKRAPALTSAFDKVSSDKDVKGFGDAGAAGIPLPAVPQISTVFAAVGLAEANVLKGADPKTEFTNAAKGVRSEIGG